MKNNKYTPTPIDTSAIKLPADMQELTELLAQNTHEIWAQGRLAEGWRYGPERNDTAKTHPGLVPYAELSEDEKAYDRNTSTETIKVLLASGYKISKPK
jgi:hypothetical protein